MSRRLKHTVICAICATAFRPHHAAQRTCSYVCAAIRRVRMYPQQYRMVEANRVNRARQERHAQTALQGLTVEAAYRLGHRTGYRSGYQRAARDGRKIA